MDQHIRFILDAADQLASDDLTNNEFLEFLRNAEVENIKCEQTVVISAAVQFIAQHQLSPEPQAALLVTYLTTVGVFFKRSLYNQTASTFNAFPLLQTPQSLKFSCNELSPFDAKNTKGRTAVLEQMVQDLGESYDVLEQEHLRLSSFQYQKDLTIHQQNEEAKRKDEAIKKLTAKAEKWKKEAEQLREEQIWLEEQSEEKSKTIRKLKKELKTGKNKIKKWFKWF